MSVRRWGLPLLISVGFVVAILVIPSKWTMFTDSYRYAKQAEEVLGVSPETAHLDALAAFCRTQTDTWASTGSAARDGLAPSDAANFWQRHYAACWDRSAAKGDVTTLDPRYQSIFTTRVGYPLLLAPFVAAFGIVSGMQVLGVLLALLGALLVYGIGRTLGLSRTAAAVGQLAYLVTPLGWWALQGLTEGLANACVMGGVWGILLLVGAGGRASSRSAGVLRDPSEEGGQQPPGIARARPVVGTVVLTTSWIVLGLTRYSTLLIAGAVLALTCGLLAAAVPNARHRWTTVAGGINGLAAITVVALSALIGLPGASVTLQDTFTRHFADPLVPDPWHQLVALDVSFWRAWAVDQLHSPAFVLLIVVAFAAMIRWAPELAWIAGGVLVIGAASIAAHPLIGEAPRLGVLMWVPVVVGLPVLAEAAIAAVKSRRRQPRTAAELESVAA